MHACAQTHLHRMFISSLLVTAKTENTNSSIDGEQFKYNKLSIQNASYDCQDACELEKRCHRIQSVQLCHLNLNM